MYSLIYLWNIFKTFCQIRKFSTQTVKNLKKEKKKCVKNAQKTQLVDRFNLECW